MNNWWQKRVFECPRCRERYLHDRAYQHDLFLCQKRAGDREKNSCPISEVVTDGAGRGRWRV